MNLKPRHKGTGSLPSPSRPLLSLVIYENGAAVEAVRPFTSVEVPHEALTAQFNLSLK